MKKFKVLTIAIIVGVCISGCVSDKKTTDTTEAQKVETTTPAEEDSETKEEEATTFTLTAEEQKLYEAYAVEKDVNVLKGVAPASVGKIFIHCGISGDWEGEYNLFSPKDFEITKEEYREFNQKDVESADLKTRKDMADLVFPLLGEGKLTEVNENECFIEYYQPVNKENGQFYFQKNEDGVWLVDYTKTLV